LLVYILPLAYSLDKTADVSFKIYNARGQIVHKENIGNSDAGTYKLIWNSGDLPTGVYLVQMRANGKMYTSKAMLSK